MPFLSFSFSMRPHRQQRTSSVSSSSPNTSPPPSRQSTFSSTTSSTFSTFSSSCDPEKCSRTCERDYHYHDPAAGEEWEMGTITARKARVLLPSSLRDQQRRRRGSTVEKRREEVEEKQKQKEAAKVWREWWI